MTLNGQPMLNDAATKVVCSLATRFVELMEELNPEWTAAYYRFRSQEVRYGSTASYAVASAVPLIGAVRWEEFYDQMNADSAELFGILQKAQGVMLLTLSAKLDYEIRFEWDDLRRWEITKLNGRTGLPLDF
jgi:hypothetical protein